eukprot:Skav228866  [mRNA]  locus=scaffold816:234008:249575:+ [translate_table: standard]
MSWSVSSFNKRLSFVRLLAIIRSSATTNKSGMEMPSFRPSNWFLAMTSTSSRWLLVRLFNTRPMLTLEETSTVKGSAQFGGWSNLPLSSTSKLSMVCTSSRQKLKSFSISLLHATCDHRLSTDATSHTSGPETNVPKAAWCPGGKASRLCTTKTSGTLSRASSTAATKASRDPMPRCCPRLANSWRRKLGNEALASNPSRLQTSRFWLCSSSAKASRSRHLEPTPSKSRLNPIFNRRNHRSFEVAKISSTPRLVADAARRHSLAVPPCANMSFS